MRWDIFCRVIDNHGDAGVCWRLAAQLARRGEAVRLFIDDASPIAWMAPQGEPGVQVLPWNAAEAAELPGGAGDVVVEAFGCELPVRVQAAIARAAHERGHAPAWLNLEYLSAEPWVARTHGLPSPVTHGPAQGLRKHFFYPGFTPGTGGLLREPGAGREGPAPDAAQWLADHGIPHADGERRVSLFCYEPTALGALLQGLAGGPTTRLLVTAGRATAATRAATDRLDVQAPGWNAAGRLRLSFLPLVPQDDFDRLLGVCDFNFVRGEDSLVRALWAGVPFCWQLYPQDDGAHEAKLAAFLDWLQPTADWRALFEAWNGLPAALPALAPQAWQPAMQAARARLLAQDDLVTQLLRFVQALRA
ncbi:MULTISPECIES: elongation factor P maturation arginine rhamnosyltransferase EarP [Ramlibacter]|uniref:Protein-arginine rhamnosyltransferase n=1 Tax=Ramlibacter aquaticus TaxID=2780094 RepID=A0ABR9SB83_9BURK|nr:MULTISPECIES: elongation factor P maturation arginine rhamnosyltransferase EarP [Ramlibacter]MBE7939609.1 elongation factor P maturation arginine rhamnosyltransferase EarP [Ramlibacter aquaticus]